MRYLLGARIRTRLTTVALILLRITVAILVFISIVQALQAVVDVGFHITTLHDKIFAVALATAFVPFGCIVFWGGKTFVLQFHNAVSFAIARMKLLSLGGRNIYKRRHEG